MADHFPRDSLVRRITSEPALNLLAGRALVLQLSHPAVAHGVEDHSDFRANPFKRLQGTLSAMHGIVNGSEDEAAEIGRRINRIHEHVVGAAYRANDPANLLWVHATLVDSTLLGYRAFVGHLSEGDTERYYQEMKRVAEPLGLHGSDQPSTYAEFRSYFDATVETLQPDDTARDLIGFVLNPRLPASLHVPLAPVIALERLVTVGTTPAVLRERIGLSWDSRRQVALGAVFLGIRAASAVQPTALRTAPTRLGNRILAALS